MDFAWPSQEKINLFQSSDLWFFLFEIRNFFTLGLTQFSLLWQESLAFAVDFQSAGIVIEQFFTPDPVFSHGSCPWTECISVELKIGRELNWKNHILMKKSPESDHLHLVLGTVKLHILFLVPQRQGFKKNKQWLSQVWSRGKACCSCQISKMGWRRNRRIQEHKIYC